MRDRDRDRERERDLERDRLLDLFLREREPDRERRRLSLSLCVGEGEYPSERITDDGIGGAFSANVSSQAGNGRVSIPPPSLLPSVLLIRLRSENIA